MPEQTSEAFTGMNTKKKCWKSLIDSVSMADISETFPIACALDEKKPERLYIMSGINGQGYGKFQFQRIMERHLFTKKSR